MSRYRSEETSLRVRIAAAREELRALDRDGFEGHYAQSSFARGMYQLGLALAGVVAGLVGARCLAAGTVAANG